MKLRDIIGMCLHLEDSETFFGKERSVCGWLRKHSFEIIIGHKKLQNQRFKQFRVEQLRFLSCPLKNNKLTKY